jgi:hypothetical protein
MADYYSLLSRAVANLPKSSPSTARRAIYERARKALNNQLRSLKPPLPESDIQREESALEEAMQRIEASFESGLAMAPPAAPTAAARPVRPPAPTAAPARAANPRPAPAPAAARVFAPPQVAAEGAAVSYAPPVAPTRPTLPRAEEPALAPNVDAQPLPPSETSAPPVGSQPRDEEPSAAAPLLKPAMPIAPPRETEASRPVAPRAEEGFRGGAWKWFLALVLGAIGAVAFAAFLLRSQNPQDLAIRTRPETPAPVETPTPGQKIVERVGGAESSLAPDAAPAAAQETPAAIPSPSDSPTAGAVAPQESAASPTATSPAPAAVPASGGRAAFLLAAPQDVQKPTVSLGSVVWSSPPANPGQGGGPGVRADVDVPELKLHATMLLRKNVDPTLPASHTIDLRLAFDEGAPFKGVKDVGVPQMRREDGPAPAPLLGVRVVISDSYFLIGLNRNDADIQRNLEAITSSGWFDFPMLLPDGRIAKLTFEKGPEGEKVFASALAAWK